MRAYRCKSCGRGLTTDLNKWGACPKCGSGEWRKLKGLTYLETIKILWITKGGLIVPPQGSILERILKRWMVDTKETGTLAQGGPPPVKLQK